MKKIIIVTGATSGIGLECVRKFLEIDDVIVFGIGRNIAKIHDLKHPRFFVKQCDVANIEQTKSLIFEIQKFGKVDCLVNAAGVTGRGDNTIVEHDLAQKMIEINILGMVIFIECILPLMRENKTGSIINLSSLADRYPRPNNAVYAATKAYVKSFSDSLRLQNAKYGIRVINIAPALIKTPMITSLGINEGTIDLDKFGDIVKFIYLQPQDICIRDIVVAPTSYEG